MMRKRTPEHDVPAPITRNAIAASSARLPGVAGAEGQQRPDGAVGAAHIFFRQPEVARHAGEGRLPAGPVGNQADHAGGQRSWRMRGKPAGMPMMPVNAAGPYTRASAAAGESGCRILGRKLAYDSRSLR
jgi:hypothetical protein